jgi:uncharacterized membrane protein
MSKAGTRAKQAVGIGSKIMPVRFLLFLAVGIAAWFGLRSMLPVGDWRDGTALAFDAAAVVFIISLVPLLRDHTDAEMRQHSRDNDAGRVIILGLTSLLTLVAMAAITGELEGARGGEPLALARLVGTLLLIWTFANSVYALHYAHAFYAPGDDSGDAAGIEFPGTKSPDYWDFAYFSFTLGMTFQTSDVAVTSTAIRKVVLFHCFAAFVFNIGVIAFTINVLGGG